MIAVVIIIQGGVKNTTTAKDFIMEHFDEVIAPLLRVALVAVGLPGE